MACRFARPSPFIASLDCTPSDPHALAAITIHPADTFTMSPTTNQYLLTADPNFDPNSTSNQSWTPVERAK